MRKVIVVGGGIGGLTAAAAFKRAGWSVRVVERAERLSEVGSGLALAPNALRVLDALGIGDSVRALSRIQGDGGIRKPDGTWLNRSSAEAAQARFAEPTVILLRAALVDLLASLLTDAELRLGTEVTGVDATSGKVTTSSGEEEGDLVVAADGIWSRIRRGLFPEHPEPRYTGLTAWRMLADAPGLSVPFGETWGRGLVFGVMPVAGDQVYCYATAPAPEGEVADDEKAVLDRLFGGWHPDVAIPLAAVDPTRILRNDVHAMVRPLPAMHHGRVAILGDAAHPMTPNLGQGACQAIEDAIVLAHTAARGAPLVEYTAARLSRTTRIARTSRLIGRLTRLTGPVAVTARDALLRLPGLNAADSVFGWHPPTD
ncbi:2-polyprenyl-6-methoxyphenol hydroxylase-like FAD-dependent oxidoreductase [Actinocorallia herbida]|uniref:2-polyprenyl-6-methoxyphenol hydroxylase-like FAD-dependent oxidoreductase n=1 Tax=Actinocorallia herbida TaxID=58109 RepID=A0A3N1CV17_9ACTN|nr:FAD-dependent monooxygenase [Actinocorallia herbida]ROO85132.1 2-polyprenyl-6-methoxyphenol hydroxylase-like FAD-dependent oxidoreductase [Actinocorallia herbida]